MNKCVILAGIGKTGSSALQCYLSFNQEHALPDGAGTLKYCALTRSGELIGGAELKEQATRSPLKYLASYTEVDTLNDFAGMRSAIAELSAIGKIPVFSQEAWCYRGQEFNDAGLLTNLDVTATVVIYVRPQVEWLNTAWWQWFAWKDGFREPRDALNTWGVDFMRWADPIERWTNAANVEKVIVRLKPSDIVRDFLALFGIVGKSDDSLHNPSLSPTMIRLLKRFGYYRGPHSAEVDAILAKYLKFRGAPPWVIDQTLATEIIDATRSSNLKLLPFLDPEDRQRMEDDPAWWDPKHYEDREIWTDEDLDLSREELLDALEQAIPAIVDLETTRESQIQQATDLNAQTNKKIEALREEFQSLARTCEQYRFEVEKLRTESRGWSNGAVRNFLRRHVFRRKT